MTAVLADAVRPRRPRAGIDIADPSYGAPVTLGQSAPLLAAAGRRMEIRFATDVLEASVPSDAFDTSCCPMPPGTSPRTSSCATPWPGCGVGAAAVPVRMGPSGDDRRAVPHLLAVLVQGQIEAGGSRGDGTSALCSGRDDLHRAAADAGWRIETSATVEGTVCRTPTGRSPRPGRTSADTRECPPCRSRSNGWSPPRPTLLRATARPRGNPPCRVSVTAT